MSSGCSSRQGTHQMAKTLTTVTWPLSAAVSRPGTAAVARSPSTAGSANCRRRLVDQHRGNQRGVAVDVGSQNSRHQRDRTQQRQQERAPRLPARACVEWSTSPRCLPRPPVSRPRSSAREPRFWPVVEHHPGDQRPAITSSDADIGRDDEGRHSGPSELMRDLPAVGAPAQLQLTAAAAQDLGAHRHQVQREEQQREGDRHDQQRRQDRASASSGRRRGSTLAGWCSVFHQSTENLMIGRLMAPTSVRIAAARAAAARIVEGAPQRDEAEIDEEQDQHRGQPRVPHPVGAPHRPAPERAGDQRQEGEGGADRRRRLGGDVGQRMPPDQSAERRQAITP